MMEISEFLEPGYYSLAIQPGRSKTSTNVTLFPSCVFFAFEMRVRMENSQDVDPIADATCWQYPHLPTTLDQPQYLDNPSHQA